LHTLGYATAAELGITSIDGQAVDPGAVIVQYTLVADANLDGTVDDADVARINNGQDAQISGWSNGDFNYDGQVSGADFDLLQRALDAGAQGA